MFKYNIIAGRIAATTTVQIKIKISFVFRFELGGY